MLTHRNLVAMLRQMHPVEGTTERDVTAAVLPFFHIYGLVVVLCLGLHRGATLVVLPRFRLEELLAAVERWRITRLPLPLRRCIWLIGLNFGRQRANWFGSFGVTSVAAFGAGELHALSPGPFILSYGMVEPDQTIDIVIRWDHRITDAALIAKALTRLEQVLNTEIAAEMRGQRQQAEPKPVRAVAT